MRCLSALSLALCAILPIKAMADQPLDLWQAYQQAAANNATYQAAAQTYKAAQDNIGVSRANLLPQITAAGNTTYTSASGSNSTVGALSLTLTQQLVNVGYWRSYSQSQLSAQLAAVNYAIAEQNLIYTLSQAYFQVLNDEEQLKYAKVNADWQYRTLQQAQQQYKVGLKAKKDVLSAQADYEAARASVVSDETALMNDLQSLSKITGMPADQLKILKSDFPLIKPSPLKADAWANAAEVMNLTVQQNKMQSKVDQAGVGVAAAGFLPTAQASGTASHNFFDSHTHSYAGTLSATYSFFSSGATLFSVRSAYDTYKADQFNIVQSERNARSLATQDYLSVLADIDQIAAYKEAILAGESAVQATFAGYKVGTETIVNLLQQQATLFQDQSLYANAIFSYIKDSITLKRDTGVLTANDMQALNSWLSTMTTSSASMLAQNQTPDSAKAE